jgi:hypothetical protein
VGEHALDGDVEGGVGVDGGAEALEPQRGGAGVLDLDVGLHVDVGEHAVGHRLGEAEGVDDVLEDVLDGGDAVDLARDGVGAEHDVADRVGPAREDLPGDVVDVVGGRVGLDPGAHVALGADLGAGQGGEDLLADGDELVVGHQLDDQTDDVAGQSGDDRLDRGLVRGEEVVAELGHGPGLERLGDAVVEHALDQVEDGVLVDRAGAQVGDLGVAEQGAGVVAGGLVEGVDAERLVALLVLVGGADDRLIKVLVEAAADAGDVRKDVLARADLGDRDALEGGLFVGLAARAGEHDAAGDQGADKGAAPQARGAAGERREGEGAGVTAAGGEGARGGF